MVSESLKTPHKRIVQEFRDLVADIRSYHTAFKFYYSEAVADVMEKLHELDCLDPDDVQRISPAIRDAATCYHSVHWWPLFRKAIRKRHRMQAAIVAISLAFALLFFWLYLPKPRNVNAVNAISALVIVEVLFFIGAIFHRMIPYRYKSVAFLVEASVALAAVAEFQRWSPYVPSAWKTVILSLPFINTHGRRQVIAAPIAEIIQLALWIVACICIVVFVRRCVSFWAKMAASGLEFGYGRPAEQCAELILAFLKVSSFINELINRMEGNVTDELDVIWIQPSKLPSNSSRLQIDNDLNKLASLVGKPWREAMRSRNGSAGLWIADQARRIEFFIRFGQSKNMLAGSNLVELRNSMTQALVQAADGNWHLIGSDTAYSQAVLVSRRKMIIRRSIALALPILAAVAATRFLAAPYVQAVVVTCLGFAVVQLLGLIDPDSPARLDVAGRLANVFKRGNG